MKRINDQAGAKEAAPERVVLYVEDEQANWEVTELRLRMKFKLLWARTDQEACEAVRTHIGQFHAILMDVQLKGSALDGMDLTRVLRGIPPKVSLPDYAKGLPPVECPLFFVTAYGNLHSPQEMTAAGGDAHVPKPVDFVKLSLMLASTHARRAMATLKSTE